MEAPEHLAQGRAAHQSVSAKPDSFCSPIAMETTSEATAASGTLRYAVPSSALGTRWFT